MKKRTRKSAKRTTPKNIINVKGALALVERLDNEFDDGGQGPEASVYRRLYREALDVETRRIDTREFGIDAPTLLRIITATDAFVEPVEAIRRAGFVQGYEYLRSLLLTGGSAAARPNRSR